MIRGLPLWIVSSLSFQGTRTLLVRVKEKVQPGLLFVSFVIVVESDASFISTTSRKFIVSVSYSKVREIAPCSIELPDVQECDASKAK